MDNSGPPEIKARNKEVNRAKTSSQLFQLEILKCTINYTQLNSTQLNPSDWAQGLTVSLYISGERESVLLMMLHIQMDDGKMDLFHALS